MALLTRTLLGLVLVAAVATPWSAHAQAVRASEAEVKAAFLYRFGSYVEWPPGAFTDASSPFVIAVAGADEVAGFLEEIVAGRTIHGHPVEVRRLSRGEPVEPAHVLFVGLGAERALESFRIMIDGGPVLLVTEVDGAVTSGSMIDLVLDRQRVRFDVAPGTAEAHGLKISSRVLAIARRVAPSR